VKHYFQCEGMLLVNKAYHHRLAESLPCFSFYKNIIPFHKLF
jgi:hypothetical protein